MIPSLRLHFFRYDAITPRAFLAFLASVRSYLFKPQLFQWRLNWKTPTLIAKICIPNSTLLLVCPSTRRFSPRLASSLMRCCKPTTHGGRASASGATATDLTESHSCVISIVLTEPTVGLGGRRGFRPYFPWRCCWSPPPRAGFSLLYSGARRGKPPPRR